MIPMMMMTMTVMMMVVTFGTQGYLKSHQNCRSNKHLGEAMETPHFEWWRLGGAPW
jgi:hypothetical protein